MNRQEFESVFFKSKFTMSIGMQLSSSKNRRFVIFKPTILFTSNDEKRMIFIKNRLELSTNITKTKKTENRPNVRYNISVQNFDEIKMIINYYFSGNINEEKLVIFLEAVEKIEEIGYIQKEGWKDEFEEIIDLKMKVNNNRKKFTKKQWINKIKKHYGDM